MGKKWTFQIAKAIDKDNQPLVTPFSGWVELDVPNYFDRLEIIKSHGLAGDEEKITNTEGIDLAIKMYNLVKDRAIKTEIVLGDETINQFEDFGSYEDSGSLINAMGRVLLRGIPLARPSTATSESSAGPQ